MLADGRYSRRSSSGPAYQKDKKAFGSILNKVSETNVPARAADTFLQSPDLRPVRDALLDKNYSGALCTRRTTLTKPLLEERAADYADIDRKSGGIEVGNAYEQMRRDLFKAANSSAKDPTAADALGKELQRFPSSL